MILTTAEVLEQLNRMGHSWTPNRWRTHMLPMLVKAGYALKRSDEQQAQYDYIAETPDAVARYMGWRKECGLPVTTKHTTSLFEMAQREHELEGTHTA